jgi:hypothetical protein
LLLAARAAPGEHGAMKSLMPCAALLAACLAAAPAQAAAPGPVSPEEFRDYAEGYTLYFERDGEPWGAESFAPGGEVRWRYPSGRCVDGVWRAYGERVCFYYGPGSEVLCWRMAREDDGTLTGTLEDGPDAGMTLTITGRDERPLICGGEGLDS